MVAEMHRNGGRKTMGIVLKNILAVLPEGDRDVIRETDIYIEAGKIAGIGNRPEGFL